MTLVSLRTETPAVATRVSVNKWVQSTNFDIVNEVTDIYVRWLLGWRNISSLHSADESQERLLRSCFICSCHVWYLKTSFT